MRWWRIPGLFAFVLFALGPAVALAGRAPQAPTDVLGRPLPVIEGRPVLTFYVNRDNRKMMREQAVRIAFDARASAPVVVVHVDLRDIPGWFHGLAKREIRKSWKECLGDVARHYREAGEVPPSWLPDALFMVADEEGGPHKALGLPESFRQPWAVAVSSDGRELVRGPFNAVTGALWHALQGPGRNGEEFTAR